MKIYAHNKSKNSKSQANNSSMNIHQVNIMKTMENIICMHEINIPHTKIITHKFKSYELKWQKLANLDLSPKLILWIQNTNQASYR